MDKLKANLQSYVMNRPTLTDTEILAIVAYLDWSTPADLREVN